MAPHGSPLFIPDLEERILDQEVRGLGSGLPLVWPQQALPLPGFLPLPAFKAKETQYMRENMNPEMCWLETVAFSMYKHIYNPFLGAVL